MFNNLQLASRYLKYRFTAANGKGHGMHSPFVFDFIRNVLGNNNDYPHPGNVELLREELLRDNRVLPIEDLGAGSRKGAQKQKTVGELASVAVKPKKYGQLLFRLARHYRPATMIELGTSLGLSTAYLSMGNRAAQIVSIEGSEAIAEVAAANFRRLDVNNIRLLTGNFDEVLPRIKPTYPSIDLGYIDGNHRYEPTLRYFQYFLDAVQNNTILIFDDIHWSPEMEKAWKEICSHPSVTASIDLFFLGFVFFRKEFKERQHFTIRF